MNIKQKSIFKVFILLIGLLLVAVVVNELIFKKIPGQNITNAQHNAIMVKLEAVKSAMDLYKLENGKYPDNINLLVDGEKKYIANRKILYDLWDRKFIYRFNENNNEYTIISLGADGKLGGADLNEDISIQFRE